MFNIRKRISDITKHFAISQKARYLPIWHPIVNDHKMSWNSSRSKVLHICSTGGLGA